MASGAWPAVKERKDCGIEIEKQQPLSFGRLGGLASETAILQLPLMMMILTHHSAASEAVMEDAEDHDRNVASGAAEFLRAHVLGDFVDPMTAGTLGGLLDTPP
ncbi:hypothetical protein M426DRAFT_15012 [Hypoxylon sp. CI-4A]|nr:hypothetical protein M426DRAFT_15012 [Hypoxylon sp. CI-4A]